MSTKLTDNFSLEELCNSKIAQEKNIDNIPSQEAIENLEKLCKEILQPIRNKYGRAITIISGYRCEELNNILGGIKRSQHIIGEAADIKCTSTSKAILFNLIKNMIENKEITVGQLIWEYGTKEEPNWIHISLPSQSNNYIKNQIIYLYSKTEKEKP